MELVHHGLLDVVQDQLLREVSFWSCLVDINLGLKRKVIKRVLNYSASSVINDLLF